MSGYKTIQNQATAEIVEKKSRFIAHVAHVETEEEALEFLESIRAQHRMARHNVYAYALRDGRVRYSDDGEPSKTAGLPTLEVIQHASLENIIVVVTRYFGGTLLGTGGLVRAYTQATLAGIDAATIVSISYCVDIIVQMNYSFYDQVLRLVEDTHARILDTDFTDSVRLTIRMLEHDQKEFTAKLAELFRGKEQVEVSQPYYTLF